MYKINAVIEYRTDAKTKNIDGASKLSAEDTARRFFRSNEVPMKNVVKKVIQENEVEWRAKVEGEGAPKQASSVNREAVDELGMKESDSVYFGQSDAILDNPVMVLIDRLKQMMKEIWEELVVSSENGVSIESLQKYEDSLRPVVEDFGAVYVGLTPKPFTLIFKYNNRHFRLKVRSKNFSWQILPESDLEAPVPEA